MNSMPAKITKNIKKNIFLSESIGKIVSKLEAGEITSHEIAEACIERIKLYNEFSKVWVTYDESVLMKQADQSAAKIRAGKKAGKLESIPVGVKDIFNTSEYPTQMGSPLWKGFTPGNDAREVYYLKKEGALIPGKTDTAEFAVHQIGNCVNPYDITRTPGTSSSGSAVAVALGMVPAAIGTQTAGSIVRPASFCGVYGCKPSFGLLPRTGMLKTTDTLDTIGFFTAMYEDLRSMFDVLRVHGSNYPISHKALSDELRQNRKKDSPWKVAFVKTHTWDDAYDHSKSAIEDFVAKISSEKEIEVTEANLPEVLKASHEVHQTIYDKTLSYYFHEESLKSEQVSDIMNEIVARGNKISANEYSQALENQNRIINEMDDFFEEYDVIISLSTAGEAPLREETEKPDPALMWTLSHLPVISCPAFASQEGLPFGLQIASRKYNDIKLFRFADHLLELNFIPEGANPLPPEPEE
jgi:Asp-tRNA(Asn)/Glu-tRNA(Gln) amidotransferase A subunit family amidase